MSDEIFITPSDVQGWRDALADVRLQIAKLREEEARLIGLIEAYNTLSGRPRIAGAERDMVNTIPRILLAASHPLLSNEIYDILVRRGICRNKASFPVALNRCLKKGTVVKLPGRRYAHASSNVTPFRAKTQT